jgi:hypothetical protein
MINPSLRRKLVHEDRWSRVFEVEPNFFAYESKLDADDVSVSVEELRREWPSWGDSEKLSFASAFRQKRQIAKRDEEILEFLMAEGNEAVWSTIALCLTRHSDQKVILNFLLERLRSGTEAKANFIQALYVLGDLAALPALHRLHDGLSERVKAPPGGDIDEWTVNDFLRCCEALAYLEKDERYQDEIRPFLNHPDPFVRLHAQNALAGPQPEEFGAAE